MTFQELFERLCHIDREAVSLLEDTGFYSEDGLDGSVRPLPDILEDSFLREQTRGLLENLEGFHEELSYLRKPARGEYTLERFPDGRYGYRDKAEKERRFSCGDSLEAKICDRYGRRRWVRTRIEHDGSDYFLWGFGDIPLCGLTVRERGESV